MNLKRMLTGSAAATLALIAGPALATGASHTVSVGGTPLTAPTTFTAATPTTGTNVLWSFKNNSGAIINLNCNRATAAGTIQPGIDVATITSTRWTGCTGPGGPLTLTQFGGWSLHSANAYSASATETIIGHVDDFELRWNNTAVPAVCKFTIRGSGASKGLASATFSESSQSLVIAETGYTGNLTLQNVSGCGGQFQSGNPANLSMTMDVTAAGGAVNVTS